MGARRFFVADVHAAGDRVQIDGSDAHKILNVLRLAGGDAVEIVDSGARVFDAKLELDGARLFARLTAGRETPRAAAITIDVAQGIPKGQKMEYVVEKMTELGVRRVIPMQSERAVPRDPGDAKLERWRRVARSASAQCGAARVLDVAAPASFADVLARFPEYDAVILPWELADVVPLREVLPGLGCGNVMVVIGPEGGFSHAEAEQAKHAGATLVSLGERILRTETAGLVLVAVLQYLWD